MIAAAESRKKRPLVCKNFIVGPSAADFRSAGADGTHFA
jgi:hypothetical protein